MKRKGKNIPSYRLNIDVTNHMIFVVVPFMYKLKFSIVLVWKLDPKTKFARKGESPFRRAGWPLDPGYRLLHGCGRQTKITLFNSRVLNTHVNNGSLSLLSLPGVVSFTDKTAREH